MADPTGTGGVAAAPAAAAPASRTRGAQASYVDNMLVAKSWISASEEPIVGASQKGDLFHIQHVEFWKKKLVEVQLL